MSVFGSWLMNWSRLNFENLVTVEYVCNEAYMGSQFDTLQIFAMKEANISEKDHKE